MIELSPLIEELPLSAFSYDKAEKLLVADASDLGLKSMWEHISIRNAKTNRSVAFKFDKAVRTYDQSETSYWEYKCTQNNDDVKDLRVRFYND